MPVTAKTKSTKSTPIQPTAVMMWSVRVSFRAGADSRQGRRGCVGAAVTFRVAFMPSRFAYSGAHNIRQLDDLGVLPLADAAGLLLGLEPTALELVADRVHHARIGQRGDVAHLAMLGDVAQEAAHDLAGPGLGQ